MGDWKVGRRRNCASPIPHPHCSFHFGAIALLWFQLLLPWSSSSQIPSVVPVHTGQPWLLESGNRFSSCGISIAKDYSSFLLILLLEMSLSLLWLFSSFSAIAISPSVSKGGGRNEFRAPLTNTLVKIDITWDVPLSSKDGCHLCVTSAVVFLGSGVTAILDHLSSYLFYRRCPGFNIF